MNLPIIIYNIDKKQISKTSISKTNCFYFYSYKNMSVNILSGNALLYSVKETGPDSIQTFEGQNFNNNFGYTLYIPVNNTYIELEIIVDSISMIYTIYLELDNIIDETNTHYNDLIINNKLPSFVELEQAIPDEFNKVELIKRLLLDFKHILKHKGTKKSIEKFLEFIGFNDSNLTIFDEYINTISKNITVNPNKQIDKKTGNYHVLYDNYDSIGFDNNNLPIREIILTNILSFEKHLLKTIALSNIYFTLDEQEITFFGLNFSSNIPFEQSITSNMNIIFDNDIFGFRKNLHIDLISYTDSDTYKKIIDNCVQKDNNIFKSEIKTYLIDFNSKIGKNIYVIDDEIFDDVNIPVEYDIAKIDRLFGNILHIDIESPNTYIEISIIDKSNITNKLIIPKIYVTDFFRRKIVLKNTSTYTINIKTTDIYNNTEEYFYDFSVNPNIQRIGIETYSSFLVGEDKNKLTLDIDSSTSISKHGISDINFILPLELIPNELSTYYNIQSPNIINWLSDNEKYFLTSLNDNFKTNSVTEKISLELMENWLNIICFKYDDNFELKLKIYDSKLCENINIDYTLLGNYHKLSDKLYIMLIDVYDRDENDVLELIKTPYYFITTLEAGLDLNKSLYDFVLVNKLNSVEKSIYNLIPDEEIFNLKIPVNYDFPLFEIKSELFPSFKTYISADSYTENIEGIDYPVIKSLFPRLIKISDENPEYSYNLNLGDVIFCKLDDKYVINQQDIVWEIFNSFTNELLFESNEYMLKFRIEDNLCYDISCNFLIDNINYNIFKKSAFSSFIKEWM